MKKQLTCCFLFLGLICASFNVQSQDAPYFFSHGNTAYMPLEKGISITNGVVWDDPEVVIPIGFDFPLFGEIITELDFTAGLGASLSPPPGSGSIAYIFTYDSDLIDRGFAEDSSQSEIVYLVEGAPGSRILKIEWQNAGFYNELNENGTTNDFVNLQLWLYETSGIIEMHFGPRAIEDNAVVHDFMSGPLIGIIDEFNEGLTEFGTLYYLFGDPEDPAVESIETADEATTLFNNVLQGNPADGKWYRFDPLLVSTSGEATALAANIRLSPQPARDLLNIEYTDPEGSGMWQVQLFTPLGQAAAPAQTASGPRTAVDLSALPAGLYVLKISVGKQQTVLKKVIKID